MLSPALAEQLRQCGRDVIAVSERIELRSLDDAEQLAAATGDARVLVTRDVADFLQLDRRWRAEGRAHAGIVLVTLRLPRKAAGPLVTALDDFLAREAPYPGFIHWL